MKIFSITQKCIIFNLLLIISLSCKKHECPEPIDTETPNDTVYVATINNSDFIDVELSTWDPNVGNPVRPYINATAWTQGGTPFNERAYMKFNYSSIPAGATITKATLTLYAYVESAFNGHNSMDGPNTVYLRKVTSAWDPTTITWNNQPGGDVASQIIVPQSTSNNQTYVIDLTEFIKDDYNTASTTEGIMMQLVTESYYRNVIFASTDAANSSLHPKLTIEYTK